MGFQPLGGCGSHSATGNIRVDLPILRQKWNSTQSAPPATRCDRRRSHFPWHSSSEDLRNSEKLGCLWMRQSRILISILLLLAAMPLAFVPSASSQGISTSYSTATQISIVTSYGYASLKATSVTVTDTSSSTKTAITISGYAGGAACYGELTVDVDAGTFSFHGSLSSPSQFDFFIFTEQQYIAFQQSECAYYGGTALFEARQVTSFEFNWSPPAAGKYYWVFSGVQRTGGVFKNIINVAVARTELKISATTIYSTQQIFVWAVMTTYTVTNLITLTSPLTVTTQSSANTTATQSNPPQEFTGMPVYVTVTAALGTFIAVALYVRRRPIRF